MHRRYGSLAALLLIVTSCERPQNIEIEKGSAADTSLPEPANESSRESEIKAAFDEVMAAIEKSHPESELWLQPGEPGLPLPFSFTLAIQHRVEAFHGKETTIIVIVDDVYRVGDEYRVLCSDFRETHFLLDCTEEQARNIVDALPEDLYWRPTFAIVCRIAGSRVASGRVRYVEVDSEVEDSEARIQEGGLYPRFYLTGSCLEAYYIKEFDVFMDWENVD